MNLQGKLQFRKTVRLSASPLTVTLSFTNMAYE